MWFVGIVGGVFVGMWWVWVVFWLELVVWCKGVFVVGYVGYLGGGVVYCLWLFVWFVVVVLVVWVGVIVLVGWVYFC